MLQRAGLKMVFSAEVRSFSKKEILLESVGFFGACHLNSKYKEELVVNTVD